MRILKNYPCYEDVGRIIIEENGGKPYTVELPRMPILKGAISNSHNEASIEVRALLDTGCDVTILNRERLLDLERVLNYAFPLERRVAHGGTKRLKPAFDLLFIFPGGHSYASKYWFIVPSDWDFKLADLWLGQDIFSQLRVCFDGVEGKVSITDPNKGICGWLRSIRKRLGRGRDKSPA